MFDDKKRSFDRTLLCISHLKVNVVLIAMGILPLSFISMIFEDDRVPLFHSLNSFNAGCSKSRRL